MVRVPDSPLWCVLLFGCVSLACWPCGAAQRRLARSTNGSWEICRRSCQWEPLAFTASSAEAAQLYEGCERSASRKFRDSIEAEAPSLIIIGAQKAGTSSIRKMSNRLPFLCFSKTFEPHFWDQWDFANRAPSVHVLQYNYFKREWNCRGNQEKVEKTPALLNVAWAPIRICQSVGRQNLMVFLRNPVDRAFSGFFESFPQGHGFSQDAKFFDLYARIEVALVKRCPALPSGKPAVDRKRGREFEECCDSVTKGFRPELSVPWPGCGCFRKGKYCTMFGDRTANAVRRGVYVSWVRMWLRYHRPENLLIVKAEDFFQNPMRVESEIACFTSPARGCNEVHAQAMHSNSATKTHTMWNSTRRMLTEFYTPYNEELDVLLGRKMNWW